MTDAIVCLGMYPLHPLGTVATEHVACRDFRVTFTEGTCANGTAATGADCPAPLMEQCSSCKPGGGLSFLHGVLGHVGFVWLYIDIFTWKENPIIRCYPDVYGELRIWICWGIVEVTGTTAA